MGFIVLTYRPSMNCLHDLSINLFESTVKHFGLCESEPTSQVFFAGDPIVYLFTTLEGEHLVMPQISANPDFPELIAITIFIILS